MRISLSDVFLGPSVHLLSLLEDRRAVAIGYLAASLLITMCALEPCFMAPMDMFAHTIVELKLALISALQVLCREGLLSRRRYFMPLVNSLPTIRLLALRSGWTRDSGLYPTLVTNFHVTLSVKAELGTQRRMANRTISTSNAESSGISVFFPWVHNSGFTSEDMGKGTSTWQIDTTPSSLTECDPSTGNNGADLEADCRRLVQRCVEQ